MEYAIEIKNLSKSFGSKKAVDDISCRIEKGQLFSMLGVNGAGKTTTIRMITGLSKPTGGDVLVYGKSVNTHMDEIKPLLNLSPQENAAAGALTVWENLVFMARLYGFSKADAEKRARELVEDFSMESELNTKAKTLSGGWQRRLSIAMALVTNPKILFLDEPTLGLDVLARRELWTVIRSLKGKVTIVLTTHYMEEAEALSDRIAVMTKGKIRAEGTLDELLAKTGAPNLEEAFIKIAEEDKNNV